MTAELEVIAETRAELLQEWLTEDFNTFIMDLDIGSDKIASQLPEVLFADSAFRKITLNPILQAGQLLLTILGGPASRPWNRQLRQIPIEWLKEFQHFLGLDIHIYNIPDFLALRLQILSNERRDSFTLAKLTYTIQEFLQELKDDGITV